MIRILLDRAFDNEHHYIHAVGLSTDTKPTTGIITGSKFVAVDTGAGYLFDETAGEWNENQQLSEAVAAYLDEHPEALDEAAIEAIFDERLDGIEEDVGGLKSAIADMNTATSAAIGKALSPKTVTDGKVTEWQFKTIPSGGGGGGGGDVTDVQVNGVSVVQDGVANVPIAGSDLGIVKENTAYGIDITSAGQLMLISPSDGDIKNGYAGTRRAIMTLNQHMAAFYGLAKAAGADMKDIASTTVGTYPEAQKSAISTMLNGPVSVSGTTPSITALPGIQYICGEVSTLDITLPASGCIDVVFQSGSTATVLTVTPPTGVTVKWANGFDPTSLDADTTYEINIKDGLGVAASWT